MVKKGPEIDIQILEANNKKEFQKLFSGIGKDEIILLLNRYSENEQEFTGKREKAIDSLYQIYKGMLSEEQEKVIAEISKLKLSEIEEDQLEEDEIIQEELPEENKEIIVSREKLEQLKSKYDPIQKLLRDNGIDPDKYGFSYRAITKINKKEEGKFTVNHKDYNNYHDFKKFHDKFIETLSEEEKNAINKHVWGKDEFVPGSLYAGNDFWEKIDDPDNELYKIRDQVREISRECKFANYKDEFQDKIDKGEIEDRTTNLLNEEDLVGLQDFLENTDIEKLKKKKLREMIARGDFIKSKIEYYIQQNPDLEERELEVLNNYLQEVDKIINDIQVKIENSGWKSIFKKFKRKESKKNNVSENVSNDLDKNIEELGSQFEAFKSLSAGQQLLVVNNFKQLFLSSIKEKTQQEFRQDLSQSKIIERIWKGAIKEYKLAKLEKQVFKNNFNLESDIYKEMMGKLIEGVKEYGPEIKVEEGKIEIQYAGEWSDLSEEEQKIVDDFNQIATEYSKVPYEWSLDSASSKQREKFKKIKEEYEDQREILMSLKKEKSKKENEEEQEREAMLYMNEVDGQIQMNQFLNSHPEVEKELSNIKDQKVWKKVTKTLFAERGIYMGAGFVLRSTTTAIIGAVALPFAAGGIGAWRANIRAKKNLKEKDFNARYGQKDKSKQAKNIVDLGERKVEYKNNEENIDIVRVRKGLIGKIDKLMNEIKGAGGSKKEELLDKLKVRLEYTEGKMRDGLINFGKEKDRLDNQYSLIHKLSEAYVFLQTNNFEKRVYKKDSEKGNFEKGDVKDVESRLEDFLDFKDKKISKERKKHIIKKTLIGAGISAAFASAGYFIRHFTGGMSSKSQGIDLEKSGTEPIPPKVDIQQEEVVNLTSVGVESDLDKINSSQVATLLGKVSEENKEEILDKLGGLEKLKFAEVDSKEGITQALELDKVVDEDMQLTIVNPDGSVVEGDLNLVHQGDIVVQGVDKSGGHHLLSFKLSGTKMSGKETLQGAYDQVAEKFKIKDVDENLKSVFNTDGQGDFVSQMNGKEAEALREFLDSKLSTGKEVEDYLENYSGDKKELYALLLKARKEGADLSNILESHGRLENSLTQTESSLSIVRQELAEKAKKLEELEKISQENFQKLEEYEQKGFFRKLFISKNNLQNKADQSTIEINKTSTQIDGLEQESQKLEKLYDTQLKYQEDLNLDPGQETINNDLDQINEEVINSNNHVIEDLKLEEQGLNQEIEQIQSDIESLTHKIEIARERDELIFGEEELKALDQKLDLKNVEADRLEENIDLLEKNNQALVDWDDAETTITQSSIAENKVDPISDVVKQEYAGKDGVLDYQEAKTMHDDLVSKEPKVVTEATLSVEKTSIYDQFFNNHNKEALLKLSQTNNKEDIIKLGKPIKINPGDGTLEKVKVGGFRFVSEDSNGNRHFNYFKVGESEKEPSGEVIFKITENEGSDGGVDNIEIIKSNNYVSEGSKLLLEQEPASMPVGDLGEFQVESDGFLDLSKLTKGCDLSEFRGATVIKLPNLESAHGLVLPEGVDTVDLSGLKDVDGLVLPEGVRVVSLGDDMSDEELRSFFTNNESLKEIHLENVVEKRSTFDGHIYGYEDKFYERDSFLKNEPATPKPEPVEPKPKPIPEPKPIPKSVGKVIESNFDEAEVLVNSEEITIDNEISWEELPKIWRAEENDSLTLKNPLIANNGQIKISNLKFIKDGPDGKKIFEFYLDNDLKNPAGQISIEQEVSSDGISGAVISDSKKFIEHSDLSMESMENFEVGDTRIIELPKGIGKEVIVEKLKGESEFNIIIPHEDENNAIEAARESCGGQVVYFKGDGGRNLDIDIDGKNYEIDPNRSFTEEGIESEFRRIGLTNLDKKSQIIEHLNKAMKPLKETILEDNKPILTLHQNGSGYNIEYYNSHPQVVEDLYINKDLDSSDFCYVNSKEVFEALKSRGLNVILQKNNEAFDDGSMSYFATRNNRVYINIEVNDGDAQTQKEMIEAINEMVKENPSLLKLKSEENLIVQK